MWADSRPARRPIRTHITRGDAGGRGREDPPAGRGGRPGPAGGPGPAAPRSDRDARSHLRRVRPGAVLRGLAERTGQDAAVGEAGGGAGGGRRDWGMPSTGGRYLHISSASTRMRRPARSPRVIVSARLPIALALALAAVCGPAWGDPPGVRPPADALLPPGAVRQFGDI